MCSNQYVRGFKNPSQWRILATVMMQCIQQCATLLMRALLVALIKPINKKKRKKYSADNILLCSIQYSILELVSFFLIFCYLLQLRP